MKLKFFKPLPLFLVGAVLLMVGIVLALPQPAAAQCGSSASSCKTCHETQGADPVNTKGDWHTQHAFGDFCEFCHAGNVQATDKDGAHQGLVDPMDDVAASCQSCHPQDLQERANKYASILGIDLSAGGGGSTTNTGSNNGVSGATAATPGSDTNCSSSVTPPLGGEEIDYNLLYTEATAPHPLLIGNWGNVITLMLIVAIAVAFLATVWNWEDWGKTIASWFTNNVQVVGDAIAISDGQPVQLAANPAVTLTELNVALRRHPQLNELWSKLVNSDSALLDELLKILNDEQGPKLVHAVSKLDLKLAKAIEGMDDQERDLMLKLLKEMK